MNMHFDKPVLIPFFNGSWQDWDGRQFVLGREWQCRISMMWNNDPISFMIIAKEGTRTDGGTIPKIARGWIDPLGRGLAGFLPHDFLCGGDFFTRLFNDMVLYEGVRWAGFSKFKSEVVYRAVRVAGSGYYSHTSLSIEKHKEHIQIIPISGHLDIK